MFKNINNLLILIAGLIICYIFYNVFILENFARPGQYTDIPVAQTQPSQQIRKSQQGMEKQAEKARLAEKA